jgi:hypothetical protein
MSNTYNLPMEEYARCGRSYLPHGDDLCHCADCVDITEDVSADWPERHPTAAAYEGGWHGGYRVGARIVQNDEPARARVMYEPSRRDVLPLRDLVKLCHPDLHPPERSELATRVTRLILDAMGAEQERQR